MTNRLAVNPVSFHSHHAHIYAYGTMKGKLFVKIRAEMKTLSTVGGPSEVGV